MGDGFERRRGCIQSRCTFAATGCGSALVWDAANGLYSTGFGHFGRERQEQRMETESLVPATERKEAVERRKTVSFKPAVSFEEETNPWLAQEARFDYAARKLNLDDGMWKVLRQPTRELIVHIPVGMDDGRIEVFTGYRVQDRSEE